MADTSQTVTALNWVAALGTPTSIAVGLALVWGTFWRRPRLSLHHRPEEWRVERTAESVPVPSLRLVARNGRLHRASKGTRVLVDGYRRAGNEQRRISLGSVPLGWTSAADQADAAVVVFPDGERPVDLGMFQSHTYVTDTGGLTNEWVLAIAPSFAPFDERNVLRAVPEGYVIRLVIGSDDGKAHRYDVCVTWDPTMKLTDNEWNSSELLDSVRLELSRATRERAHETFGSIVGRTFRTSRRSTSAA